MTIRQCSIIFLAACLSAGSTSSGPLLFDGELAIQHIAKQIAFGPREPRNQLAKKNTLSYLQQTLAPLADDISIQHFQAYQLEGAGAQLFSGIDGDYFSILGLPLLPIMEFLRAKKLLVD